MRKYFMRPTRVLGLALLAGPAFLFAQNQTDQAPPPQPDYQQHSGWRRADDPPPPPAPMQNSQAGTADRGATPADSGSPQPYAQQPYPQQTYPQQQQPYAQGDPRDQYGQPVHGGAMGQRPPMGPQYQGPPQYQGGQYQGGPQYQGGMNQQAPPPQAPVPAQLTVKPGTYVTVRINQPLSSDHNQQGDPFIATLVRPLVVDGVVVAQVGETLSGRVVEAQKAGRVQGTSRLAVQLTDMELVDGQSVPIQSQLVNRTGSTSVGRDAAAIGGTTALGAAIGAAADWGRGAAIGAGAGAAAGIIGVLLTRGQPTVLYPEQMLTFRIERPVTIATDHAPQAFRYVEPEDYNQGLQASRPMSPAGGCGPYGCRPPSLYGPSPYYYGGGYSPFYYGPSFAFFYGPRFYGGGHYFRGGHGRR